MSLDGGYDNPFDPTAELRQLTGGNQGTQVPPGSTLQGQYGYNPGTGYGPNGSGVAQVAANGQFGGSYAANPYSAEGGWSAPQAGLNSNVYGTNLFDASRPYALTPSTAPSVVAAANAAYPSGGSAAAGQAIDQAMGVPGGLPNGYGAAGQQQSASNPFDPGYASATGYAGVGTGGVDPYVSPSGQVGGSAGSAGSGSGAGGGSAATNPSFQDRGYWDPSSFARGYQHVLDEQGLGGVTDNPAARFAQGDAQRAYANYVIASALGQAPPDSTESSIRSYITGGGSGIQGTAGLAALKGAIQQVMDGSMSVSDPRYSGIANLIDLAYNSPQQIGTLFANVLPRGVGSANLGNYIYRVGMQRQNAAGNATPASFLLSALAGLGF